MTDRSPTWTARDLAAAGREVPERFQITLSVALAGADATAALVQCRERLRLLPGRRLVARVEIAGTTWLLKLFFGASARRYRDREAQGSERLKAAGVATPALCGRVEDAEGSAHGLLFEYLHDARTVESADTAALTCCAAQLGRLHEAGGRHDDLHLSNFLLDLECGSPRVWLIDGDGVRRGARGRLSRRAGLDNLAVLCAQREPMRDADIPALYRAYAAVRNWPTTGAQARDGEAALQRATRRQRRERVHRYLEKTQRACSEYFCERSFRHYFVCVREARPDLGSFVDDPDRCIRDGELLKDGVSATVVRARIGDRHCVVKRYNLKGAGHRIRRALKPAARFRVAWCNGQRLRLLGLSTARPLALLERRFGPLRGVAYLVMEDIEGPDLKQVVERGGLTPALLDSVTRLFGSLRDLGLVHGDTKATNFLVRGADGAGADVALVDLDSMRESTTGGARDVRRFLANWTGQPDVRARFAAAFREIGLD